MKIFKSIIACFLVVLTVFFSIPVASFAQIDWLSLKAHAASSITVEDTSYGVLDVDVKAKKITFDDDRYIIKSHYDYLFDCAGEGYAIIKKSGVDEYILIGPEGIVKTYLSEEKPEVSLITSYSLEFPYALYSVLNPETNKYDVYNGTSGEYFEYGFDERPYTFTSHSYYSERYDYFSKLICVKKDSRYGVMDNKGRLIHKTLYTDIRTYKNCLVGSVKLEEGGGGIVLLSNKSTTGTQVVYKSFMSADDIVYAVSDETGLFAAISTKGLYSITGYKYENFESYANNGFGQDYLVYNGKIYVYGKYYDGSGRWRVDAICTDGTIVDLCAKYGAATCSVDMIDNAIQLSTSSGESQKYYLVTPDGNTIIKASDDLYEVSITEGCYNGLISTYVNYGSKKGSFLFKSSGNVFFEDVSIDTVEEINRFVGFAKYNSDQYNCYLYDTGRNEYVFENVYFHGIGSYTNSCQDYLQGSNGVLCVSKSRTDGKFGLYNYETGDFSGYIFDGYKVKVEKITNGDRIAWVCTMYSEPTHTYEKRIAINEKFEVICEDFYKISLFGTNLIADEKEIYDFNGKKLAEIVHGIHDKINYDEGIVVTSGSNGKGVMNCNGKYILEEEYDDVSGSQNYLTYVNNYGYKYSTSSVVDNRGYALIYGQYDDDGYYSGICKSGTISFVKDNSIYFYDMTKALGDYSESDLSPVTEDMLFGEYNSFLNNGFYNSMGSVVENNILTVLSQYGYSEKVVAFIQSALNGQLGYIFGKIIEIFPSFNSLSEEKMREELALECIQQIDIDVLADVVKEVADTYDLADKINKTQKEIMNLTSPLSKLKFVGIWEDNIFNANLIYDILNFVDKNQKLIDEVMDELDLTIKTTELVISYLSVFTVQIGIVERLMRLIPTNTDLYLGLERIYKQLKSPVGILKAFTTDLLTKEGIKFAAGIIEDGFFEVVAGKHATLTSIIIEIGCLIISSLIDSPELEDIEKATLSLVNTITLKNAVKSLQEGIKGSYENNIPRDIEQVKANYAMVYTAYINSLKAGLEYAKEIATDDLKAAIESRIEEYEIRLVYRSYIKNCLVNARAQWEYTIEANKAVLSKLNVKYPKGEGRIPLTELMDTAYSNISYTSPGRSVHYTIDIPQRVDGYEVSGVASGTFNCDNVITGVYFSDGVETIRTGAFEGCENLDAVFFGNSVSEIEVNAFDGCSSLRHISLPDSLTNIDQNSFAGNDELTIESSNKDILDIFKDAETITTVAKAIEISNVEIAKEPMVKTVDLQGEINTEGLTLKVNYKDGTSEEITEGFYCEIVERKLGENEVIVTYGGHCDSYTVTVNKSMCTYTVKYLDEELNEIRTALQATAEADSKITVVVPEIEGYIPVSIEEEKTIGYINEFVVEYKKISGKSIAEATVTISDYDISYPDKPLDITVVLDSVTLQKDIDYTVEYQINAYYGYGDAIVKGLGEYKDLLSVEFDICESKHSFTEYYVYYNATCSRGTIKVAYCDNGCGTRDKIEVEGTKLEHDYETATCTAPKTCKVCKATSGSALGHNWSVATCTSAKKCKVCGATSGSKLGHSYSNECDTTCNRNGCGAKRSTTHSYKNVTTKATLTKNGKVESKCSCGKVSKTTIIYYPKTIKLSATSYTYNGKAKTPSVTVKDSKGNTLKKDIDYTVKYASGRKSTGKYAVTITFKGKYSGTKTLYFNILPRKTSKITLACSTTEIKSSWKSVTGASGYKVELLNSKGKVVKTASTTKTAYTFKKLSKVTTYKVRVTAYKTIDKKKVYSTVSTTITTSTAPAKATLSKVTVGAKTATVVWKKVSGASGYEVTYSTSKKFKSAKTATVKKGLSVKTTIKKLTKGKTHYFKVRAYKTVDGKKVYGSWSAAKSVKVK